MKWYEYLFKPIAVTYRGISYVLGSAFNFVGDTFKGGSRIVTGASVAVSDICGDAANVTNGIGNAINTVGSNVNKYIWAGVAVAALAILAPAFASASAARGSEKPAGDATNKLSNSREPTATIAPVVLSPAPVDSGNQQSAASSAPARSAAPTSEIEI